MRMTYISSVSGIPDMNICANPSTGRGNLGENVHWFYVKCPYVFNEHNEHRHVCVGVVNNISDMNRHENTSNGSGDTGE